LKLLLEGRNAVIYGGGGSIGGAVARAFAREGATVHLAGRTQAKLDAVADAIRAAGGRAETAQLDALDERAVDEHAGAIAAQHGSLDISLSVISQQDVQGTPLVEMAVDDVMRPVEVTTRAMFITARAAARQMIPQRSGVILAFGGYGDPHPNLGGLQIAFQAAEALRRALSVELGPHGIRVVTLQTNGIAESISDPDFRAKIEAGIVANTMLERGATLDDVGNAAVFAASDWARTVTASKINITCGGFVD
jgi:NAD(P)-dependent dehydrogenase (short-subunit alcohol dehydrogenase family)